MENQSKTNDERSSLVKMVRAVKIVSNSITYKFSEGPLFPATTFVGKMLGTLGFRNPDEDLGVLGTYIAVSALADFIEVYSDIAKNKDLPIYYEKLKQIREFTEEEERKISGRKPYSCFERHVFYDLPKWTYKKLKW